MDVAYYLSELLGQLGEVNVPGLGYFVQIRIEGYYSTADSTFYPPKHRVQFDQQTIDDDDDTLAQYIADKKNISLASSRYFTEKYISNLKHEAILKDVPLADLGFLYIEGPTITFKAADVMSNDPAVFGYAPVQLNKMEGASFIHQLESYSQVTKEPEQLKLPEPDPAYELPPATPLTYESVAQEAEAYYTPPEPSYTPKPEPPYVPPVYESYKPQTEPYIPPVRPEEQEEFVFHGKTYVPPERRSYRWVWITLLIIIAAGALGMLAIYKFRPALFKQLSGVMPEPVAVKTPLRHDSLNTTPVPKNDTTKKDTTKKADTVIKTAAAPAQNLTTPAIDSTKVRYEVIGASAASQAEADKDIKNFVSLGITDAHVVADATGRRLKISLGTYTSQTKAEIAKTTLLKSGNVQKDIYIQQINPKR